MDEVQIAIDAVPTLLGRLVLLSGMFDEANGTYQPSLIGIPAGACPRAERLHRQMTIEWLSTGFEQQVRDATDCIRGLGGPAMARFVLQPYNRLLPRHLDPMHREHFAETIPHVIAVACTRED